jgi:hypothetical protein
MAHFNIFKTMSETKNLSVNVDAAAVNAQYESEHRDSATNKKKTEFNPKNYLQARLNQGETSKTLTIRLLPFSPDGGSPFKKVFIHTVKVNKELSPGGWRTFVCPTHNKMGDRCPFCEVSGEARKRRNESTNEVEKKKFGDIEFMNRAKAAWIVRCIERDHEEDGPKFWLFNDSAKKDGVYDKIMNIFFERKKAAERKGKESNIFDVNDGKDLIITLTRDQNGKTVTKVVDDEDKSPLTESYEQGMAWINDDKKWDEVYTVKPYEYMEIVVKGGVPVFDKSQNKYVDSAEKAEADKKAAEEELKENLTEHTRDFSDFPKKEEGDKSVGGIIIDGEDDLPF